MHYRAHNKHPPLRGDCNFVIVNSELHNDFDDFKHKELQPGYSYLEINKLLQHYLNSKPHDGTSTMEKYGVTFLCLHESMMDDLCEWVEKLCEKHSRIGNEAFITGT